MLTTVCEKGGHFHTSSVVIFLSKNYTSNKTHTLWVYFKNIFCFCCTFNSIKSVKKTF
jgi:hypothetical protein